MKREGRATIFFVYMEVTKVRGQNMPIWIVRGEGGREKKKKKKKRKKVRQRGCFRDGKKKEKERERKKKKERREIQDTPHPTQKRKRTNEREKYRTQCKQKIANDKVGNVIPSYQKQNGTDCGNYY